MRHTITSLLIYWINAAIFSILLKGDFLFSWQALWRGTVWQVWGKVCSMVEFGMDCLAVVRYVMAWCALLCLIHQVSYDQLQLRDITKKAGYAFFIFLPDSF